ncbi:hypothetical protein CLV63_101120 [Murinocardiopsis flavida]|uniref:Histidine kinase/HSP90-like ATPase domain-containing protein n=2 Tax=Murinocardiopsis flavida TaxID=645275 RepID=A0A2P8DTU7_9ACTN|nr:hypothetical protein CLV63_101120 [Murinocardiopsis flavida]
MARYAAISTAVGCARREVAHTLREWDLPGLLDAAELLASELVTNAVTATGDDTDRPLRYTELRGLALIGMELRAEDGVLHIYVWDRAMAPPVRKEVGFDAEDGRGILLVDMISSHWGHYYPEFGGKVVWCEVATDTDTDTDAADETRDADPADGTRGGG